MNVTLFRHSSSIVDSFITRRVISADLTSVVSSNLSHHLNRSVVGGRMASSSATAVQQEISFHLAIALVLKMALIVTTVILNCIIIFIILFSIKKRSFSNFLFLSATIGDLFIGLFSQPFMLVYDVYDYWPYGYWSCMYWLITDYSSYSVSITSLLMISIHRYRQINSIAVKEHLNRCRVFSIVLLWLGSYGFWGLVIMPITRENYMSYACEIVYSFTVVTLSECFTLVLPIMLICVFNFRIYVGLRERMQRSLAGKRFSRTDIGLLKDPISMANDFKALDGDGQNADNNPSDADDLNGDALKSKGLTRGDFLSNSEMENLMDKAVVAKNKFTKTISDNSIIELAELNRINEIGRILPSSSRDTFNLEATSRFKMDKRSTSYVRLQIINNLNRYRINRDRKAFLCLFMVSTSLIISWSAFLVMWPIKAYCRECINETILNLGAWMIYSSSATNAVLLLIFHDNFQKEFLDIVRRILGCLKPAVSNSPKRFVAEISKPQLTTAAANE